MLDLAEEPLLGLLLVGLAIILVFGTVWWLGVPLRDWHAKLEERFLFGIPWGTLVVVGGLFAVYLFVQDGWTNWDRPVVVAFMASSIFDPTGWFFAGFAHSSPGHLRGNVTTTLVFAPIVEWVWGHHPPERRRSWEPDWLRRPVLRAFVLFPLGVGVIGVIAALTSWGPVIGFSVGAYALIGAAVINYPVAAIIALVARQTVRVLWNAWTDPVTITETAVRTVRPSWYGTAVQGHLIGLLLGVLLGLLLLRYRNRRPNPAIVGVATVFLGMYLSLWALWWILGPERFVVFRAIGVALVFGLGIAVALIVSHPDSRPSGLPVDLRRVAVGVIILAVLGMGIISLGINLATVEAPDRPVAAEVNDYELYYGQNVPDGMMNVIDIDAMGLTTDVTTSGVVIVSEDRNAWYQPVSSVELRNRGLRSFTVGGIGWSEPVWVQRMGWQPIGNSPVYRVRIGVEERWHHAFASEPKSADPTVAGHNFTFHAEPGQFQIGIEYRDSVEKIQIPEDGETVAVHDVKIEREGSLLRAKADNTTVTIATRERYQ